MSGTTLWLDGNSIDLPRDALVRVFQHVRVVELFTQCIFVCREWNEVITQSILPDGAHHSDRVRLPPLYLNDRRQRRRLHADDDVVDGPSDEDEPGPSGIAAAEQTGEHGADEEKEGEPVTDQAELARVSKADVAIAVRWNRLVTNSIERRRRCPILWELQKDGYRTWRQTYGDGTGPRSAASDVANPPAASRFMFYPSLALNVLGIIRVEDPEGDIFGTVDLSDMRRLSDVAWMVTRLQHIYNSHPATSTASRFLQMINMVSGWTGVELASARVFVSHWGLFPIAFPRSLLVARRRSRNPWLVGEEDDHPSGSQAPSTGGPDGHGAAPSTGVEIPAVRPHDSPSDILEGLGVDSSLLEHPPAEVPPSLLQSFMVDLVGAPGLILQLYHLATGEAPPQTGDPRPSIEEEGFPISFFPASQIGGARPYFLLCHSAKTDLYIGFVGCICGA